ncbi:hypothetical protein QTG54_010047 [Skeletonema marinoi]|nr:hypothetical protein QTG54_010047 [Skeletonema marinoi]
MASHSS